MGDLCNTAVVLAAGPGTRIQHGNCIVPKPLIEMGGLYLAERCILTLHAAGIRHFRVVVGAYKVQVMQALNERRSLYDLDIKFIECDNFELGNGVSLAAGVRDFSGPFLLTMADHVMSPKLIENFLFEAKKNPARAYLATDCNIASIFDLDDATKVLVKNGMIVEIAKNLPRYNQIDTGLFYFAGGSNALVTGVVEGGQNSVSEVVAEIQATEGFYALPIAHGAFWQDVDTPAMAVEAERRLLQSQLKSSDSAA